MTRDGEPGCEPEPAVVPAVFGDRTDVARRYVALLAGWGIERGLIGPRERGRLWERHVLNSALIAPLVPAGAHVIDVGAGAGLPGIPLALARPDLDVELLEPLARRVDFLADVRAELGLHVTVTRGRAQEQPPGRADVAVARAVARLATLVPLALPLVRPGGLLLALKGAAAAEEIAEARASTDRLCATATYERHDLSLDDVSVTVVAVGRPGRGRRTP